jgi:hypothetical protein
MWCVYLQNIPNYFHYTYDDNASLNEFTFIYYILLQYHNKDRTGEIISTEWRGGGYPNKFRRMCLRVDLKGMWQKEGSRQ